MALVVFGLFGVGRGNSPNADGQVLYAAGRAWLLGGNPYDLQSLLAVDPANPLPFYYPPQTGALCVGLALFSYTIARYIWLVTNLSAIAAICGLTTVLMRARPRAAGAEDPWRASVMAAVIIGNPFTSQVVWWGQTSLLAFAATLGTWYFYTRQRRALAGICLGVAALKPQLCVLVILWLALERELKVIVVAGATALAFAAYPMFTRGPLNVFLEWRAGLLANYAVEPNLPSFPHKIGAGSLLYSVHFPILLPDALWISLGAAFVCALWIFRARFNNLERIGLLMAITLTFNGYLHDYDYVAVIPILAGLWNVCRVSHARSIIAILLVALLFAPARIGQQLGFVQWRTVVLVVLAMMLVRFRATAPVRPPG